jgi:alginate O-acetyltransferase complex protein AlgI
MVFSSVLFLFYFLPCFFLAYYCLHNSKNVLLLFSVVFYAWGEPKYILLLLASVTVNYVIGLKISDSHYYRRMWLTIGIVINLVSLGVFKYANFILHTAAASTGLPLSATPLHIALPLGISFYTFHSLSYLIDVYRGDARAERSLRDLGVYIGMFPQLIAGPIIRYKTIANELHNPVLSSHRTAQGIRLLIIGLSQKVLIANTLAPSADSIFSLSPEQLSPALSWLGIACYTLQIYCDFAGYSTMAIGLGLMIGFTYPQNFNYPYIAESVTEFWHRWHMSLSAWFRDYLYIPLGGNRGSSISTYRNLVIVFFLCGLWHGAAWTFVCWGLTHGGLLVLERLGFHRILQMLPRILRHVYLLLSVMLSWVLFRSESLDSAFTYLAATAGFGAGSVAAPPLHRFLHADVVIALIAGVLVATPLGAALARRIFDRIMATGALLSWAAEISSLAILMLLVSSSLAGGAYNPFIYFRF